MKDVRGFIDMKNRFLNTRIKTQLICLVSFAVLIFGIVCPSMISSNSTVSVWIGIGIALGSVYIIWDLSIKIREFLKEIN
jgi:hypothetical protein